MINSKINHRGVTVTLGGRSSKLGKQTQVENRSQRIQNGDTGPGIGWVCRYTREELMDIAIRRKLFIKNNNTKPIIWQENTKEGKNVVQVGKQVDYHPMSDGKKNMIMTLRVQNINGIRQIINIRNVLLEYSVISKRELIKMEETYLPEDSQKTGISTGLLDHDKHAIRSFIQDLIKKRNSVESS